jgi:SPX domain protein involved in polyphosphate accumulation
MIDSKIDNRKELEKHFRFEFKYLLDPVTYMKVRDFVESIGLKHDSNVEGDTYNITSLYFDTFGLDDYYDKLGGFLKRKKVRARVYGKNIAKDGEGVHLEAKHKHDMYIGKKRTKISKDTWKSFIEGHSDEVLDEFGLSIKTEGRVPTAIVRYEREAFVETFFSRIRLTFDKNIKVIKYNDLEPLGNYDYDTTSVLDSGVVMEIKFNEILPWWFGFMVRKFNLKRGAYSKYAHALDKLYQHNPLPR